MPLSLSLSASESQGWVSGQQLCRSLLVFALYVPRSFGLKLAPKGQGLCRTKCPKGLHHLSHKVTTISALRDENFGRGTKKLIRLEFFNTVSILSKLLTAFNGKLDTPS